jgi:HEAT repeat protein
VAILFRVEQGAVARIRTFGIDCPLDAGGLPFHWLTGVRAADSVAVLTQNASGRLQDAAVHAIAMHAGEEATKALATFATSGQAVELRRSACFWLVKARGRQGFEIVRRVLRDDSSEKVREHAIFALSRSPDPEAITAIIQAAKEDKAAHVRGRALFWLAQKASRQTLGVISQAIERDPETEVKKSALLALTRLPENEGVPALIHVARTNQNPAVRKQAIFWLGRSKDPRALQFIEDLLTKK